MLVGKFVTSYYVGKNLKGESMMSVGDIRPTLLRQHRRITWRVTERDRSSPRTQHLLGRGTWPSAFWFSCRLLTRRRLVILPLWLHNCMHHDHGSQQSGLYINPFRARHNAYTIHDLAIGATFKTSPRLPCELRDRVLSYPVPHEEKIFTISGSNNGETHKVNYVVTPDSINLT